jgi:hypothetical protein
MQVTDDAETTETTDATASDETTTDETTTTDITVGENIQDFFGYQWDKVKGVGNDIVDETEIVVDTTSGTFTGMGETMTNQHTTPVNCPTGEDGAVANDAEGNACTDAMCNEL